MGTTASSDRNDQHPKPAALKRELGVVAATMLGLGSILGTGVFVSIGLAAGSAGPAVVAAVAIAAFVACCNALSSAQLAANHPVSGGTYEYGYTYLNPTLGFTAGWMFLCAKSASAATAALGFAGYIGMTLQLGKPAEIGLAVGVVAVMTALILTGIKRTSLVNTVIVSITLVTLGAFVIVGLFKAFDLSNFTPFFAAPENARAEAASAAENNLLAGTFDNPIAGLLQASALAFVAYTGYGRVATLGEEVHDPRKTIPCTILSTLGVSLLVYISVAFVAVGAVGAGTYYSLTKESAAPLEAISETFEIPGLHYVLLIGGCTAMLGVLLNLVLGLSRVLLAMGRRRDAPSGLATITTTSSTPTAAVITTGVIVALLACVGDIGLTWSFSAFTVLVYYAITNVCALRLTDEQRLYPRIFSIMGVVCCLGLAFWVQPRVWLVGVGLIIAGLVWHAVARKLRTADQS